MDILPSQAFRRQRFGQSPSQQGVLGVVANRDGRKRPDRGGRGPARVTGVIAARRVDAIYVPPSATNSLILSVLCRTRCRDEHDSLDDDNGHGLGRRVLPVADFPFDFAGGWRPISLHRMVCGDSAIRIAYAVVSH